MLGLPRPKLPTCYSGRNPSNKPPEPLRVSYERSAASGSPQSFVIHSGLGIEFEVFAELREAASEELTQLGRRLGILFESL